MLRRSRLLLVLLLAGCGSAAYSSPGPGGGTTIAPPPPPPPPPPGIVPPEVILDEGEQMGGLATATIAATLRQRHGDLQRCFEMLLLLSPGLPPGRLDVRFTITPLGGVAEAQVVQSPSDDPGFTACVLEEVQGITFQSSDAPTVVTWPYRFEQSGTGPAGGE